MKFSTQIHQVLALLIFSLLAVPCRGQEVSAAGSAAVAGAPSEKEEHDKFRHDTQQLFSNRQYAELETLAQELRASKARERGGSWKIYQFYWAMECADDEPEAVWLRHQVIHAEWVKKFPRSITPRVAQARFFIKYAWHARGSGYAKTVTEEGWRLFRERLDTARTMLEKSKSMTPRCPMWWLSRLTVAMGQGETPEHYEMMFQKAKALEPQFFGYDTARAQFLLPRWHGEPGDWEAAAEKEIERSGEYGLEIYARVVNAQRSFYNNVFKETKASWSKTMQGFEQMRKNYPNSKEVINHYGRVAWLAGDREQTKKLIEEIGDDQIPDIWGKKGDEFARAKAWASSSP